MAAQAQAELDELGNWEVKTAALEEEESHYLRQVGQLGTTLSAQRKAAGERMARQVEVELADLKMEKAQFGVDLAHSRPCRRGLFGRWSPGGL